MLYTVVYVSCYWTCKLLVAHGNSWCNRLIKPRVHSRILLQLAHFLSFLLLLCILSMHGLLSLSAIIRNGVIIVQAVT